MCTVALLVRTGIVGTLDHQISAQSSLELAGKAGTNDESHVSWLSGATSEDQCNSLTGTTRLDI